MSFAGWPFLALFLPLALGGFYALPAGAAARARQAWLIGASILFYAVSGLESLAVLAASIALNFTAGTVLAGDRLPGVGGRRAVTWAAVALNVGLLALFKIDALATRGAGGFLSASDILIPLALSFVTFQQIGFVVACYRRQLRPQPFDYLFFVLFFPQLVMGPIVQYRDIARQLRAGALALASRQDVAVGLAIFTFGLAKKLLLADPLADPVDAVFAAAATGVAPSTADAWFAIAGFQFQLFLDFSAYADMAIGLARMFGVALPINFDQPFKAVNRFDMWRRWHITFVLFMRTHVFTPLARHWRLPAAAALFATAMLSGLWHGLGATFFLWSLMQATILLGLHLRSKARREAAPKGPARVRAIAATFLVTCLLGAMFRSPNLLAASSIYPALTGLGSGAPAVAGWEEALRMLAAASVIWLLPDAQRLFARYWTATDPRPDAPRGRGAAPGGLLFHLDARWGAAFGLLLVLTLLFAGSGERFIYVQF